MTVFRVSLAAAILLIASVDGAPAFSRPASGVLIAQASGPVQLGPRRAVTPEEDARKPAPSTPAAPVSPSGGAGPVDVEALKAVDSDSVGVIDDAEGGLGADMWAGSDRGFVTRVIAMLPGRVESPSVRDLMRRLLLTRAAAPAGKGNGPSLLSLRINALYALGDLQSATALVASAPIGPIDESLVRIEVESRFFRQDTAGACGQVRGAAQEFTDLYWQQATAYCLALAGRTAEAALMSDILAERSESIHTSFFAAMDRLSGAAPPTVASLENPSALHLSMMRAAGLPLPADVVDKAPPAALNAIALGPNAALDLRLDAAERAAAAGVLSGKLLNEIYGAVSFESAMLDAPLTRADGIWGTKGRALLMRSAIGQAVPAARAEALQEAFNLARKKGGWRVTAVAAQPVLLSMTPTPDLAWFAGAAGRALISVGEFDTARQWIAMGLKQAREEAGGKPGPGALWPLGILIGAEEAGSVTPEALHGWWRAHAEAAGPDAAPAARALFGLLDALDIAVPFSLWAPVFEPAPPDNATTAPGLAMRIALGRAAAAERRGESVALSLVALGNAGPAPTNLLAVDMAIRALRKVGLAVEAQRMALEAAVAAGL